MVYEIDKNKLWQVYDRGTVVPRQEIQEIQEVATINNKISNKQFCASFEIELIKYASKINIKQIHHHDQQSPSTLLWSFSIQSLMTKINDNIIYSCISHRTSTSGVVLLSAKESVY